MEFIKVSIENHKAVKESRRGYNTKKDTDEMMKLTKSELIKQIKMQRFQMSALRGLLTKHEKAITNLLKAQKCDDIEGELQRICTGVSKWQSSFISSHFGS